MPTDPAHGIAARPASLRELALTVRQVAGVLEQTAAVLATAGGMAAPAPDPVPRAAELLAADARAALLAEAGAQHQVATARAAAADSYVTDDARIAERMGQR